MNGSSRSLLGRTSFLWAAGFVVLAAVEGFAVLAADDVSANATFFAGYFVISHTGLVLPLWAASLVFALVYLALETGDRGRRRQRLGGLHFAFTAGGGLLVLAPVMMLAIQPGLADEGVESFRQLNRIASLGYLIVLLAQLFFVAVLIDAFRRAPDPV